MVIQRGFLQWRLATNIHEVSVYKMDQSRKGKMSVFLSAEKQGEWESHKTKKTAILSAAKLPFRRVQYVSPTVQDTLREFLFLCVTFFSHFPLHEYFYLYPPHPTPPRVTFLMVRPVFFFYGNKEKQSMFTTSDHLIASNYN